MSGETKRGPHEITMLRLRNELIDKVCDERDALRASNAELREALTHLIEMFNDARKLGARETSLGLGSELWHVVKIGKAALARTK